MALARATTAWVSPASRGSISVEMRPVTDWASIAPTFTAGHEPGAARCVSRNQPGREGHVEGHVTSRDRGLTEGQVDAVRLERRHVAEGGVVGGRRRDLEGVGDGGLERAGDVRVVEDVEQQVDCRRRRGVLGAVLRGVTARVQDPVRRSEVQPCNCTATAGPLPAS